MINRKSYFVGNVELSVLEGGPNDGPVVIFIHGIPANARLWNKVLPHFVAKGYRVYAPDLPGYGDTKSPLVGHDYSLKGASDILSQWMFENNINDVWMVAHDIGGGVAQIFACEHEEQLSMLTLSNCIVSDRWPVFTIGMLQKAAKLGLYPALTMLGGMRDPYTQYEMKRAVYDKSVLTKKIKSEIFWEDKVFDKQGRLRFAKHLSSLSPVQLASYETSLRNINVPILLAWAKNDPNQPWDSTGVYLDSLLNHSDHVFIEEAGHFFQLEKAEAYSEKLMNWNDSLA